MQAGAEVIGDILELARYRIKGGERWTVLADDMIRAEGGLSFWRLR